MIKGRNKYAGRCEKCNKIVGKEKGFFALVRRKKRKLNPLNFSRIKWTTYHKKCMEIGN